MEEKIECIYITDKGEDMHITLRKAKVMKGILILILFLCISIMLALFLTSTIENAKIRNTQYLKEASEQVSRIIRIKLCDSLNYVEGCASAFNIYEDIHSKNALQMLESFSKSSNFTRMWISKPDGYALSSDHGISTTLGRDYQKDAMNGNSGISDMMLSNYVNGKIIIIYAPIYKDNEVIGMLHGTFEIDKLVEMLNIGETNFDSYSYLFDSNGHMIPLAKERYSKEKENNIYMYFNSKYVEQDKMIILKENVEKGKVGQLTFKFENSVRYAYYIPIGINQLYVMTAIPRNVVIMQSKPELVSGIILIIEFLILGVILVIFTIYTERLSNTELEESKRIGLEQYKIAISYMGQAVFEYHIDEQKMISMNNEMELYGLSPVMENIPDDLIKTGFIMKNSKDCFLNMFEVIKKGSDFASCDVEICKNNDSRAWYRFNLSNILDQNGNSIKVIGFIQDITNEKRIEKRLKEEELYRETILSETIFIYEFNLSNNMVSLIHESSTARDEFWESERYVFSCYGNELLHPDDIEQLSNFFSPAHFWEMYYNKVDEECQQYRVLNKLNEWVWIESTIHILYDNNTEGVKSIVYVQDINEEKLKHTELKLRAEKDSLTGLYNRATLQEKIDKILMNNETTKVEHAFIMFDLDYFKLINDNYGHAAGDLLLQMIGEILRSEFRSTDIFGRLGGDEFIIFIRNIKKEDFFVSKKCDIFSDKVRKIASKSGWDVMVTLSMGITIAPKDGSSFEVLYHKADKALYWAKQHGRNQYVYYKDELER